MALCCNASSGTSLGVPSAIAEGHPVLVLAVSQPGGKVLQISLRPEQKPVVEQWIANYHRLKSQIEEICELNQTLLRPEP